MVKARYLVVVGLALMLSGFLLAAAGGTASGVPTVLHPVTTTTAHTTTTGVVTRESFCHRTGAVTHPYVFLRTDVNSIIRQGHNTHTGPIFPATGPDGKWGDIIPPFNFTGGHFPGLNWPAGAAILRNGCRVIPPVTTTTTAHQTTTSSSSTTTTTEKATTTTAHETTTTEKATTTTTGATTTTTMGTTTTTMAGTTTTTAEINTLLTLRALVINHFGGTATVQDFSLEANGPVDLDGITGSPSVTLASVPPGSYQLRDRILVAAALGYISSGWDCVGSASTTISSVVLDAGEDAVCLIVFSDTPAEVTTTTTAAASTTTVAGGGTTVPATTTTTEEKETTPTTQPVIVVTPATPVSTSLPNTGYDPSRMLESAGVLLILGGAGVAVSRRRKKV